MSAGTAIPDSGGLLDRTPRVSVLMAVHNGLPYVRQTLDDLLRQTLEDFELVVVDDASDDGTNEVLQRRASADRRLKIVRNEKNLKLPASLNRGLGACTAPLVARADADDRYPPDRLQRQVDFMDRNPDVGLLSSAVRKIDKEGNFYATTRFPTEDGPIRVRELFVNSFAHPGVMFRTDLVREVGGYDPDYFAGEDADLWARMRSRTKAANLSEPLVYYRVLDRSMMRTRSEAGKALSLSVRQRLLSDYLGRPVSLDETRHLVRVFHARRNVPPTPEDFDVAHAGFREVLAAVRRRESRSTVVYFRAQVADAYLQHHRLTSSEGEPSRLLSTALRWNPRLLLSRRVAAEVAKAILPRAVVRLIRSARHVAEPVER